ncbi:hypothetical protein [Solibacillus cecembensis]|uniref:hypothetical protein n=1 Tax=Solibacillus cecembensis TaxID=459347 RepID=UPI0007175429
MSKISSIIQTIDFAKQLLTVQVQLEEARVTNEFYARLIAGYQKVSLAEKQMQVKNTCSHISSTME